MSEHRSEERDRSGANAAMSARAKSEGMSRVHLYSPNQRKLTMAQNRLIGSRPASSARAACSLPCRTRSKRLTQGSCGTTR